MNEEIEIPVGQTALYTCAERAHENDLEDRLFEDPLAKVLAGKRGHELLENFHGVNGGVRKLPIALSVVLRTTFLDDILRWSMEQGIRQVVIVAAGMDTRYSRFASSPLAHNTCLWELDFPEVLNYKSKVVQEATSVDAVNKFKSYQKVGVDLTTATWEDSLIKSGYDQSQKSLWIVEGLFVYLKDEDIENLIEKIGNLASVGSLFAGDWMNESYLSSSLTLGFRNIFSGFNSPFINGTNHDEFVDMTLQKATIHTRLYSLGDHGNKFANRVPKNFMETARFFPINEVKWQGIPRHFLFVGERVENTSDKVSDGFCQQFPPLEPANSECDSKLSCGKQQIGETITDTLKSLLKELLEDEIDNDMSLVSSGMDSFLFTILGNKIISAFDLPFSCLPLFFKCDSILDLEKTIKFCQGDIDLF